MNIEKIIEVPTGHIVIVEGKKGKLELVSLGDYGKDVNIKCDALGLDRIPSPVRHSQMLPLEEKWVITISTQYGCSMGCKFCDVPKVGPGKNATLEDLINQVKAGISLHPEVKKTNRLNVHFARMGEPSWNGRSVIGATEYLYEYLKDFAHFHPVVSTMMPRGNKKLKDFIHKWMHLKNELLEGEAGLQLSINSTDEIEREHIFNGNALRLSEIADIMKEIPYVRGRKITLNFAVADSWTIDPLVLKHWFSPADYIIKLTPMHKTNAANEHDIKTSGDYTEYYPYAHIEEQLKAEGYDVLVFIASKEEDESCITCGNAILGGSVIR